MARKEKRTIYDLKAWEMLSSGEIVVIIQDSLKRVVTIDFVNALSFAQRDISDGYMYMILPFSHWLAGFNARQGTECKTFEDIRDYYRKGGVLHW
jgi:hypothetical protein